MLGTLLGILVTKLPYSPITAAIRARVAAWWVFQVFGLKPIHEFPASMLMLRRRQGFWRRERR